MGQAECVISPGSPVKLNSLNGWMAILNLICQWFPWSFLIFFQSTYVYANLKKYHESDLPHQDESCFVKSLPKMTGWWFMHQTDNDPWTHTTDFNCFGEGEENLVSRGNSQWHHRFSQDACVVMLSGCGVEWLIPWHSWLVASSSCPRPEGNLLMQKPT